MQVYNHERIRADDIKFIHIISILIVIYNNSINMKILMSPWKRLTENFQIVPSIKHSIA